MRIFKTPALIMAVFTSIRFRYKQTEKVIYLSFDDGPVPLATPFVLAELEKHNARATFFCVGENAERYPDLLQSIIHGGHRLANHTYNHLNGWKTSAADYLANIDKCNELITSNLFRPPYGKLKLNQFKLIRRQYKIVLWDNVSYDFDPALSSDRCLMQLKKNVRSGSIVVFHDSLKSLTTLEVVLPEILAYWQASGYSFEIITD